MLLAVGEDVLFGQLAARLRLQHHDGLDFLPYRRIGHADHARGLDLVVLVQHVFDVLRKHRVALVLDQVFGAVVEVEIAFFVHAHDVARAQPALAVDVDEHLVRLLLGVPVAEHDIGSLEDQFAGLARRHELGSLRSDHRRHHVRDRQTERSGLGAVARIDVAAGAGLGQAIALGDGRAGALGPVRHGRFVQGVGAGDDELQPLPVDLVGVLVVLEILVQRGHAVEHRSLVPLHCFEDALGVGCGEQHQGVALGEAVEHEHYLAVDMEKGEKGDDHLLAFVEAGKGSLACDLSRDQIEMGQHHALGIAGGAAGVGQGGDVSFGIDGGGGHARCALGEQILQPVHVFALGDGGRGNGDVTEDLAEEGFAEKFLECRQVFTHVGDDDMIERGAGLLHLVEQDVLADYDARATVLELEPDLVAGVYGTDGSDGAAELQRREIRDHELRAVQQIEADAVAFLQPQAGERAGKPVGKSA